MSIDTTYPFQPCDNEGPVFKEPWEAQAFGMVVALHQSGAFSWDEWAAHLNAEISAAQREGDPDLGDTYYRHWLRALEKIVSEKKLSTPAEISARVKKWRAAYINTPHGQAIELANASD
ncbi:MAG TPA: nitrile hydratase accessory protein [Gammaproteobacteria bacterium]|nr:nitrile hydratase accessory protein [Gammaproteobacteria bacterium]